MGSTRTLEVQPTKLTEGLDWEYKGKREFKDDSKICGLKNWVDDSVIYWHGEDLGDANFGGGGPEVYFGMFTMRLRKE